MDMSTCELTSNIRSVKDYISMQNKNIASLNDWLRVRSLIVNKQGDTFSQLIFRIDSDFDFNYPPSTNCLNLIKL